MYIRCYKFIFVLIISSIFVTTTIPAYAVDIDANTHSATTKIYINGESNKIEVSVPSKIYACLNNETDDASLILPSASATKIENMSSFAVAISDIYTLAHGSFAVGKINASGSTQTKNNVVYSLTMDADTVDLQSTKHTPPSDWIVSGNDTLDILHSATIEECTVDLGTPVSFMEIGWTFTKSS
jgi:hypothetical protein